MLSLVVRTLGRAFLFRTVCWKHCHDGATAQPARRFAERTFVCPKLMVKEAKDAEMVKATEASEHDLEPRKLEYSPSRKPRLAPDPPELGDTRVESMALMAFCFVGLQVPRLPPSTLPSCANVPSPPLQPSTPYAAAAPLCTLHSAPLLPRVAQASYLTWGYLQEKVMTTEYTTGRFPSAAFCVFSNRVFAIVVAAIAMLLQHGRVHVPAPLWAFAPCSLSNSLSSYGQYQAPSPSPRQTLSTPVSHVPLHPLAYPYTPSHTHTPP